MGNDAAVMEAITSANVACGFHAGDPLVMKKTVALCREKGVAIGAHPGYPDLVGFDAEIWPVPPMKFILTASINRRAEALLQSQRFVFAARCRTEQCTIRARKTRKSPWR